MTERLYLEDSYLKECKAKITAVEGRKVELSHTILNPHGETFAHPQPHDKGVIVMGGKMIDVSKAVKENGRIMHYLKEKPPPLGASVDCFLDWARRYRMMRNHTAMHLLQHLCEELFGARLAKDMECRDHITHIDLEVDHLSDERVRHLEKIANLKIREDMPIKTYFLPLEQAQEHISNSMVSKSKKKLVSAQDQIRFVQMGDYPPMVCYGTVVRNLREVGQLKILAKHGHMFEVKTGGIKRIAFVVV
jgi:Ser-tRNA(Ala) deacylase AlaX